MTSESGVGWHALVGRDREDLAYRLPRPEGIDSQLVVVVEILVTQGQRVAPLTHELLRQSTYESRVADVAKTASEALQEPLAMVHLLEEHDPAIRGDRASIEPSGDLAAS